MSAPAKPLDLSPYDRFKIKPLILHEDRTCESCEPGEPNDPLVFCWRIYGHQKGYAAVTAFCDCPTKAEAEAMVALLERHKKLTSLKRQKRARKEDHLGSYSVGREETPYDTPASLI